MTRARFLPHLLRRDERAKSRMFLCFSIQAIFCKVSWGVDERSRGKMFKGKGVVLKSRIQVCHGWMPRITGLSEERKVGKLVVMHHPYSIRQMGQGLFTFKKCLGEEKQKHTNICYHEPEKNVRFSCEHQSRPLITAGVIFWNFRISFPLWSFLNSRASWFFPKGINSLPMGPYTSLPTT
jgi:hypothetical protein